MTAQYLNDPTGAIVVRHDVSARGVFDGDSLNKHWGSAMENAQNQITLTVIACSLNGVNAPFRGGVWESHGLLLL
jgi:hypothetical protein